MMWVHSLPLVSGDDQLLVVGQPAGYAVDMERQRLVEMLRQLHAELAQAEGSDPETLALLRTLTDDIQRVLGKRRDESSGATEPATISLKNLLLKFEANHPELASAIGKIADGLAAMGI